MFRFTIRDVLWLMVVVGLALGCWAQTAKFNDMKREVDALEQNLTSLDWQLKQSEKLSETLISELYKRTGKRYRGMVREPEGHRIIYDDN